MVNCCNDPTEPPKGDRRELIRAEERYGNLLLELFTDDPERVLLKQLPLCSTYLKELAALRAHYPAVRETAIAALGVDSKAVLERIAKQEAGSVFEALARQRLQELL
jgi:hypothetical protein